MVEATSPAQISSGDWVGQSIREIFGPTPAGPASPDDIRRMATQLSARYTLERNPSTGIITVSRSRTFSAAGDGAGPDPLIADITRTYLPAARASLAAVDTNVCVPDACPDDIADAIRQIAELIGVIEDEAPRRDSRFQVTLHINELIGCEGNSLVRSLEARLNAAWARTGHRTAALERAIRNVQAVHQMLSAFEDAYTEFVKPENRIMSAAIETVRRCAPHLTAHVYALRQCFERLEIGSCELETYEIDFSDTGIGNTTFPTLPLSEALATITGEAARWLTLALQDRHDNAETIAGSAVLLGRIGEGLKGSEIANHFHLGVEAAGVLATEIDRLAAYLKVVVSRITPPKTGTTAGPATPRR